MPLRLFLRARGTIFVLPGLRLHRRKLQQEISVRKLSVSLVVVLALGLAAQAQEFHAAFGFGTVTAPSASSNANASFPSLSGGLYPSFSGNVIIWHHIGFGGDVAWRAHQTIYSGTQGNFGIVQPYRPIFYDFNGVYAPRLSKYAGVELQAGIGAESVHFYTGNVTCSAFSGCSNYQSSNHFMGHFGGGLRLYAKGNFFIRPEAHVYFVRNNFEFSGPRATRYGMSIGYTWGESK